MGRDTKNDLAPLDRYEDRVEIGVLSDVDEMRTFSAMAQLSCTDQ